MALAPSPIVAAGSAFKHKAGAATYLHLRGPGPGPASAQSGEATLCTQRARLLGQRGGQPDVHLGDKPDTETCAYRIGARAFDKGNGCPRSVSNHCGRRGLATRTQRGAP